MSKLATLLALLLATGFTSSAADTILPDLNAVRREIYEKTSRRTAFDFTAIVSFVQRTANDPYNMLVAATDGTNSVALSSFGNTSDSPHFNPGDIVRFQGEISTLSSQRRIASIRHFTILGHDQAPAPTRVKISTLLDAGSDFRLTTIAGCVRDARRSETNPQWGLMVVNDGTGSVYTSLPLTDAEFPKFLNLVGSNAELTGITIPWTTSLRYRIGRTFRLSDLKSIRVLDRPTREDLPLIDSIAPLGPSEVAALGRHRALGKVIATWQDNHALVKTIRGDIIGIEFADAPAPEYGTYIEATGFPESDLFRINLALANWKEANLPSVDDGAVLPIRGSDPASGTRHGKLVRLVGTVLSTTTAANGRPCGLFVHADGTTIPVDLSRSVTQQGNPPAVGSEIELTGIYIVETEAWKPNSTFPQIRRFHLAPRTGDDIRVIASPPWWTPARLLIIIGLLLIATVGAAVWNVSLQRVAERRSRELLKEQLARIESDLKVGERTRLSVELHDTLSQNLLGASMEINTAEQLVSEADALKHLGIASKTLRASRDELRNCLWDLRSQALEEPDMNAAIRKTLEPYVSDVDLQVRFNVPRPLFTDNTAHALMRIIRELVLNAIRHGHAKSVKIAGSREKGQLLFSVRDDGCGFDPSAVPGISQGHFGLQGVRERLRLFKGSVRIDSSPGTGTYVSARLQLPTNETEKI